MAYRNAASNWTSVEPRMDGRYDLCVTDEFEWISVCPNDFGGFDAISLATTIAETRIVDGVPTIQLSNCSFLYDPDPDAVDVTGTMVQAGCVAIGRDADCNATGPWTFGIPVSVDKHDLVAHDAYGPVDSQRILIERDLVISTGTTVADVDLSAAAVLELVPIEIVGLELEDTIATSNMLITRNLTYSTIFNGTQPIVYVAPRSVLVSDDRQKIEVEASAPGVFRHGISRYEGGSITFELLPKLTGVVSFSSWDDVTASWSSLPPFTHAGLMTRSLTSAGISSKLVAASENWLEARGLTSLHFDETVPGYDPRWTFTADERQFFVTQESSVGQLGSTVTERR